MNKIHLSRLSASPLSLTLLCLLLLASVASACQGQALGEDDPLAAYRPALLPQHAGLLEEAGPLPEYQIAFQVDPQELEVRGRMTVVLPPQPGDTPPTELYFRLYPNLSHYAGDMEIELVTVNGQGAPFSYAASGTAIHVSVPPSVAESGGALAVGMQWTMSPGTWPTDRYTLLGASEGVLSFPLSYPMPAIRDDDVPGGWHLELGEAHGDAAFSETALYDVTVTVPEGYVAVTTGSLTGISGSTSAPDDAEDGRPWKDWHFVAGPVREFALFVSDQYRLAEAEADGVRIHSWYLAGDEISGRAAAEYTAAALRIYNALFGPYPYAELDVVAGPITYRGMEYPGLFELGIELYRDKADELEFRIAHEVAHQWWYALVGNDPVNDPWLDEGLAEYATYFYRQLTSGQQMADSLASFRWQSAYEYAQREGLDAVVAQPVAAFQGNYEIIVYAKAALFHHALRELMGEEQYLALLRRYGEQYRFQVARPEEFLALAEEIAGPAVQDLYRQWILETQEPPAPSDEQGEG